MNEHREWHFAERKETETVAPTTTIVAATCTHAELGKKILDERTPL